MSTTLQCVVLKAPAGVEDSSPRSFIWMLLLQYVKNCLFQALYSRDLPHDEYVAESRFLSTAERPHQLRGWDRGNQSEIKAPRIKRRLYEYP